MKFLNKAKACLALLVLTAVSFGAAAVPPDYTTMTSQVDFTTVITGFLAIGAILMVMYVAHKGVKLIIGMLRGG